MERGIARMVLRVRICLASMSALMASTSSLSAAVRSLRVSSGMMFSALSARAGAPGAAHARGRRETAWSRVRGPCVTSGGSV